MWSFLSFFRGLFCLRHNSNIWRVGSFKLRSKIELGQPVPTAYYTSTYLSKLPGQETLNFSEKQKWSFLSRLIRFWIKSGGGYGNGVGGRVDWILEIRVECWQLFEQLAGEKREPGGCLSWKLRKWMKSTDAEMFSNSVISWYGEFWKWYRWMNVFKNILATSVVATLDAVRENDPRGDVSVPNHCLHAQHSHIHLQYFYQPTANPNLAGIAKIVRPREKSSISAISRFQNAAQKKNMNDVRRQEMSENTLLSFLIFPKFSFLRFAEKLRGGCWNKPNSKNAHWPGGHTLRRTIPKSCAITYFREKPTFFSKFQKLFSWPFIETLISFKNCYNRTEAFLKVFFLFFRFSDNWICYEIKSAKNIFLQKKVHFGNFQTVVTHLNSGLKSVLGKKKKKINIEK